MGSMFKKLKLLCAIVKGNPIIFGIPLLLIAISYMFNNNPLLLYKKLLIPNQSLQEVCTKIVSGIIALAAISFIFAIILNIIFKVFSNFNGSSKLFLKDCSFLVFVLALFLLLPMNIIVDKLSKLVRYYDFIYCFANYFLISIKNIIFCFVMYFAVYKIKAKKNLVVSRFPYSFFKQVLELLLIAFFSGLIQAPLYYDSWLLNLPIEIHYIERLQLIFSILTNTLIILYTALVYFGWDGKKTYYKLVSGEN